MSGQYDYPVNVPPLDTFDPNYSIYDQQYGNYQRLSGPQTSHEGYAFWYRPESHAQDSVYHQDPSMFGRPMSLIQPMTEQQGIKHRRTRSGCFTCRSRRVKCDEKRPTCERCRKGNRTCEFPANASSAKRTKTGDSSSMNGENPTDRLESIQDESEEEDCEEDEQLMPPPPRSSQPVLKTDREAPASDHSRPVQRSRQQSTTSATSTDRPSPSASETTDLDTPVSPRIKRQAPFGPSQGWRNVKPNLKEDIQTYLIFQVEHMTHYHYLFRIDGDDFVHCELIDMALTFEPLLYAVVAFAAYHFTVRRPDSEACFDDFWKYYCKSIVSLRKHLQSKKPRDDLVLLTVLQLATFEEYMGDWTNLVTHHKAAHGILVNRYTKETIMETDRSRKMFDWFIRLDVIAGLMAVRDVSIDRTWLVYTHDWLAQRIGSRKRSSMTDKMEFLTKGIGLAGHDIAHTFAQANADFDKATFSITSIMTQVDELNTRLQDLRRFIESMNDPNLAGAVEAPEVKTEDSIIQTDIPLFRGDLWPLNFVWMDWYGILVLLKNQTFLALRKAQALGLVQQHAQTLGIQCTGILEELQKYAQIQCEIFDAVSRSPTAPAGAALSCYAALGLSTVFLPREPPPADQTYMTWARRQLANIEKQGYVWPPHFRQEMARLWDDNTIEEWWLPNNEGKSRILYEIRAVVADRMTAASHGPDDGRNDLREIKGLFEKMKVTNDENPSTSFNAAFVNSMDGMVQAASLVSSPEATSSVGSASGFSPQPSASAPIGDQSISRSRTSSRSAVNSPPHSLPHT